MKKLIIGLLLFGMTAATANITFVARKKAVGGGVSYDFTETFDGTGYVNSGVITENGTPNEDYTTTILEGTHSLYIGTTGDTIDVDVDDAATQFSVYFQFRWGTWDSFENLISFRTPPTEIGRVLLETRGSGTLRFYNGTVSSDATSVVPSSGTTYHIWLDFAQESGGGGNGTTSLYVSTTSTKPGTASGTPITTGDESNTLAKLRIGDASTSIIDRVVYDNDENIGSAP